MTQYTKEFREQAILLSDEIGVKKAAPECTKKDKRPFTPHLTVANRDIPSGASVAALEVLHQLNLVEDFPVDNVAIFERCGGKWTVVWYGEM